MTQFIYLLKNILVSYTFWQLSINCYKFWYALLFFDTGSHVAQGAFNLAYAARTTWTPRGQEWQEAAPCPTLWTCCHMETFFQLLLLEGEFASFNTSGN